MHKKLVEDLTNELLTLMGVKAKISVSEDKDNKVLEVKIDVPQEQGLLIGYHGETLSALQSFLGIAVKQETGEWVRVSVDIADYRFKQEERLLKLANQSAQRARETKEPQALYNLTPGQRRIIHLALGNEKDLVTESQGEDEERYLVVKVKTG